VFGEVADRDRAEVVATRMVIIKVSGNRVALGRDGEVKATCKRERERLQSRIVVVASSVGAAEFAIAVEVR